ncbi:MAG: hypothetical protein ABFC42_10215 [Sulfuricella sp.]
MSFHVPNKYRIRTGLAGSDDSIGNAGAFEVKLKHGQIVFVIASDGMGWEHVSVSRRDRCPTWDEMCQVKAIFWDDEDCVVQFHPPRSEYVNNHPNCLRLWRQVGAEFPLPDSILVGLKDAA